MNRTRTLPLFFIVVLIAAMGASPPPKAKKAAPLATSPDELTSMGLSSFSVIHSGNVSDYAFYQFKITYMGPQHKTTPSCFGVGTGRTWNLAAFEPYQRAYSYENDEAGRTVLTLSPTEFKAFVDGIAVYPTLTDTNLVVEPNASIMILRDAGPQTRCWEHLCPTRAQTDTLFEALHDAFPDSVRQGIVDSFRHQMAGVRR